VAHNATTLSPLTDDVTIDPTEGRVLTAEPPIAESAHLLGHGREGVQGGKKEEVPRSNFSACHRRARG
jgi:hypothetical protein